MVNLVQSSSTIIIHLTLKVAPQPAQQDGSQVASAGSGASVTNETPIEVHIKFN